MFYTLHFSLPVLFHGLGLEVHDFFHCFGRMYVDGPPDRIKTLLMVIVLQCKRNQALPHQGNASV